MNEVYPGAAGAGGPPVRRPRAESWHIVFHPAGTLAPLFCVCSGGGDISGYRDLAAALPEALPVHVFGVPPLAPGEIFPSIPRLAEIYVAEIRRRQPVGPYRLCGHSFGGLVVYELARLLAARGDGVGLLVLLDTMHPRYARGMPPAERARFRARYLVDRVARYARNIATGRIDRLARDALRFVRGRMKRTAYRVARSAFGLLGGLPPWLAENDELVLAAAWHGYEPGFYAGRLVLLNAADRPAEFAADRMRGWDRCASGAIELHVVPGDHLSIMHPPHVQALAGRIVAYLDPAGPAPQP